MTHDEFSHAVSNVLNDTHNLLVQKNQAYGDAALNPVRIFSKSNATQGIRVRIDDKLSRLARGEEAGEDTIRDLIGYLVLLRVAQREENNGS